MNKSTQQYLPVDVYSNADRRDCTNGGVTSNPDVQLVVPCKDGHITREEAEKHYTILEVGRILDTIHFKPEGATGHTMFGGNFVCTSDSRFNKQYGRQPVHVHDRVE